MSEDELLRIGIQCGRQTVGNNPKMMVAFEWIKCLLSGRSPFARLQTEGIDEIIIYGVTDLGELLVREAVKEGYKVLGITDKKIVIGQYDFDCIPVIAREELCFYKDKCIVVTAVGFWEDIKRELDQLGCSKVIALWELM